MSPEIIDIVYKDLSITEKMFWNHFSGGEILLKKDAFLEIIKRTRKYFSKDIGISTNGFWAKNKEVSTSIVNELVQAGVSGIAVSTDYYHTPYINKEYAKNAAEAITNSGLKTHSYVMGARCNADVSNADNTNKETEALSSFVQGSTKMPLAPTAIRSIGKGSYINIPKKQDLPTGKCSDLSECLGKRGPLNPAMVWVDPYGNVMVCYGIIIGNVYKTPFIDIISNYKTDDFPLIKSISELGPYSLYKEALDKGVMKETKFYDVCDVCYTSRKALQNEFPTILGPQECYPN